MTVKELLKINMNLNRGVLTDYLKDLSDADLLLRPVPAANHIAWQLGHLIVSEQEMLTELGHAMPKLPAGFAAAHSRENATSNDSASFATKADYLDLLQRVRAAALAALERTSEADFGKAAPEKMRGYAATVAEVFNILGAHDMMHAGQFTVVRRMLGKPILM